MAEAAAPDRRTRSVTEPGVDVEVGEAWPLAAEIEEQPEPEEVPAMACRGGGGAA